jgi:hypothetical protein
MKITLSKKEVLHFAQLRDDGMKPEYLTLEADLIERMPKALARGFLTLEDLTAVTKWKWKGSRPTDLANLNTREEIEEVTRFAFKSSSERIRIMSLLILNGVQWPMASVILHFAFEDRYPILDRRAMKAVTGVEKIPTYNFDLWKTYYSLCRKKIHNYEISMRDLDKALWYVGERKGIAINQKK